jgi:hypothetical protein
MMPLVSLCKASQVFQAGQATSVAKAKGFAALVIVGHNG